MPSHPSRAHNATTAALVRTSLHLQQHLQTLLDAQSSGLLSGLGQPTDDDTSSVSSSVPISTPPPIQSIIGPRVTPIRQPPKKRIGLSSARRGISTTMAELADIKVQESELLREEVKERESALRITSSFTSKISGLEAQIKDIHSSPTSQTIASLRMQEKALETETQDLETRLWDMKAQQRQLLSKIEELDNNLQSKLSSYTAALALTNKDIKAFMSEPGIQPPTRGKVEGFWTLPPKRRTLQIAASQWRDEQQTLVQQQRDINHERTALQEGKVVWDAVVADVQGVEQILQAEMQRPVEGGMRKVLRFLDRAVESIEEKLRCVEERGWKFLVCAVGAEVEACVEGREILREALEAGDGGDGDDGNQRGKEEGLQTEMGGWKGDGVANGRSVEKSEDEDDGPGHDLLIEHDGQRDGDR